MNEFMASMCMVEMNSSTTNLVKEDIPLLQKTHESNIFTRLDSKPYIYNRRHVRKFHRTRILLSRCCSWIWRKCWREKELQSRTIIIGKQSVERYPPNVIRNQKYSILTFLPLVLFEQFKFFLNLYFLIMALSQFVPDLRLGYLYTYWGPLIFVLTVTLFREAIDDFRRHQRDEEVNSQKYTKIFRTKDHTISSELVSSSKLKVGDLIMVEKDQRVPADLVLIRTTETSGACFVRTDQLDGETDWKLRLAVPETQKLDSDENVFDIHATIFAEKPQRDIHTFIGTFKMEGSAEHSLDLENTLWANCVVASGSALGLVVYTGAETRSVMNNSQPRSKVGLLDIEINQLTKVLFAAVIGLAFVMMCLKGFSGPWYRYMFRFVLLFSYIIPISLRVNLDMGKAFYSWSMQRDEEMPDTVVRSTTIPEELGRISYLLSDKTGTLTQNDMVFKRLHLGTVYYGHDAFDQVEQQLNAIYNVNGEPLPGGSHANSLTLSASGVMGTKLRRSEHTRLLEAVKAIALCHNVTPAYDGSDQNSSVAGDVTEMASDEEFLTYIKEKEPSYQASSPDEVALVKWSERVGLAVIKRTQTRMYLKTPVNQISKYTILQMFPFTPETKRMGIILKEDKTGEIVFYLKGADVIMTKIVQYADWLEEECGNMAREGLRTLVVAKKQLTEEQYLDFEARLNAARLSITDRGARVSAEVEKLEHDMELLCVTGVEDKLQDNVRQTLELLRNAGIKIWMLTGDKLETATCIAKSSRLVSRNQECFVFSPITARIEDAQIQLHNFQKKHDCALIISGDTLEIFLKYYQKEFLEVACRSPAVVCCRCSPTQKAQVVSLIKLHTGKRTAAVGDGGNDVSMIQAADTGIGIAGREGKQASLAADFSIPQFSHLARLIVVHGRNSYKRSASLSQFVIHRGLIISTMQAIFSAVFYFSSVSLYQGLLMVGYATIYTMFPVFSLVLDKDVSGRIALTYPELYKELSKGRSLSFKTFFIWVLVSIYQGGVIMYGALILFEDEFIHIVAISFTALILTELIMVALTVRTWHYLIVLAELFSLAVYILSLVVFKNYFDASFLQTREFLWKVLLITLVSCFPLYILKFLRKKFSPPSYSKLS